MRVAPVGLVRRSSERLDHQHLVTTVILLQPFHQPVVKTADFDDRHIFLVAGRGLPQLLPKLLQFGPLCADLAAKEDVAVLVA